MSDYIHGYSEAEQRRLALMQTILNDAEIARLDLSGVTRILDVGAGLCHMAVALADAQHGMGNLNAFVLGFSLPSVPHKLGQFLPVPAVAGSRTEEVDSLRGFLVS